MRKYLILVLSICFFGGVASAYEDPSIAGWDNKSKYAQQAGRGGSRPVVTLKWVRLANTGINATSVVSGDALIYDIVSSDDGITVRRTTTSADGAFAGIAVTTILTADTASTFDVQSDIGKRNWGWIAVHGPVMATTGAGAGNGRSAGEACITSTDSTIITGYQTTNDAIGYQRGGLKCIFMDTPTASSSSTKVFLSNE